MPDMRAYPMSVANVLGIRHPETLRYSFLDTGLRRYDERGFREALMNFCSCGCFQIRFPLILSTQSALIFSFEKYCVQNSF